MLEHFIAMMEREIASVENGIVKGMCSDYTSYRETVATLTAYRHAIEIAKRCFAEDEDWQD